ncbi:transmembrane protein 45B-like [Elgaria multicarinata webbii]|uniref:transmembrane protein 45B-like n=1 Tax=Elgaria multicarinata webbii TaxID=159646 RepID=UPI002FCD49C3
MGTFHGHMLPGGIFLLLGFVWAVKYSLKFFSQNSKPALQRKSCFNRLEFVEWGVIVIASFIGIITEQFNSGTYFQVYNEEDHKWVNLSAWQHTTVFLFFLIAGMMGLLQQCKLQIPLGLDYLLLSVAFFTEGMLFYFHTDRHSLMDQHIHAMILVPTFGCAFCLLLEVHFRNHLILELLRTSMLLTQGTWLWQISFVLYPHWGASNWDENDHESITFINMALCWHFAAVVLILSIIYGIVYCVFKRQERKFRETAIEIQQFNQDKKSYTALLNGSDEE